jgi:hypothetical protein
VTHGERRQVWRRGNEYGVRGLDQLAPVDERLLDRFDALVCRILHRDRWEAGIDRYYGHGLSVDFTVLSAIDVGPQGGVSASGSTRDDDD